MRYVIAIIFLLCIIQFRVADPILNAAGAAEVEKKQGRDNQLLQRIDFGNSYIMGQTIKSGAVYLLKRKNSEIKSMLKIRENYRKEILEDFHIKDMKVKQ
jgi:hypothetical protein